MAPRVAQMPPACLAGVLRYRFSTLQREYNRALQAGVKEECTLRKVGFKQIIPEIAFNGSEDVTVMMQRVQNRGGKVLFVLFGTPIFGGHHSSTFDLDEDVIRNGADFLAAMHTAATG